MTKSMAILMLIGSMMLMLINVQSVATCIMVPLISPAMASKATEMFNLEINSFSSSCQPSLQDNCMQKEIMVALPFTLEFPMNEYPLKFLKRYGKGPPWR